MARHALMTEKVFHATTAEELAAHATRVRSLRLDMLVTEIVPGPEDAYHSYYAYIDQAGAPVVEATKHKLRQFPVGFGLATYHVTEMDDETIEVGRRFCSGLGARGLVCVEFKRHARDGRLTLIECNSRFTAANELMRHAGLDLALLAYNRAVGLPDPPRGRFRTGVRMWHPVEDTRAFLVSRRRGETTFLRWVGSLLHRQHFPLFSWRDPMPSLVSNARLPRRALGRRDRTAAARTVEAP
jgi:predicted ATP-grasp superfamily ATP-dependent carboligase